MAWSKHRELHSKRPLNIVNIPCVPQTAPKHEGTSNASKTLKLALLNVRSLAGKTFLINDLITEHSLDFMFLTETWLDQSNSGAVLIETAPPNYSFISEARVSRRGGGVAVLFNESFQCKQLSPGSFQSFEYVALQLKAPSKVVFLNVYRPPKYCTDFFNDLSELLSVICVDV